jgi:hypothetical protein
MEFHAGQALVHHAGNGVGTTAPDTDHFDLGTEEQFLLNFEFQIVEPVDVGHGFSFRPLVRTHAIYCFNTSPRKPGAFRF